jgi:hypothetical protein
MATQAAGRPSRLAAVACGSTWVHPPVALRNELVCAGVIGVECAHKLLARAPIHVGCSQAVRQGGRRERIHIVFTGSHVPTASTGSPASRGLEIADTGPAACRRRRRRQRLASHAKLVRINIFTTGCGGGALTMALEMI